MTPEKQAEDADLTLALKAGLSPWHGDVLTQLRRIADALEGANENPGVPTGRRKKDNPDA